LAALGAPIRDQSHIFKLFQKVNSQKFGRILCVPARLKYQGEHPFSVYVILQKRHGARLGMRRSSVGGILQALEV
jgi:hypothetical protein